MRKLSFILRGLVGTAAVLTAVGCQPTHREPAPPHTTPSVATSALDRRADLGAPKSTPPVEVAPPALVAEEEGPSPSQLIADARDALSAGELDRALKLARLAVLEQPGRSAAWNTLGRVQLRRGERAAAMDSFEQAVDANPSSAWARNNHGLALLYDERYEEAVDELEEATDLLPDVGLMWNNLGMAYEHVDRIEEARSAYKRAMSLEHKGATENFVRIEGVRSLRRSAKADLPTVDEDLPMIDHGM